MLPHELDLPHLALVQVLYRCPVQPRVHPEEPRLQNLEEVSVALTDPHYRVHTAVTVSLWLISITLAISFDDLGVVLALTGAVAASCLGYILPALLYLKSYETELNAAREVLNKESSVYRPDYREQIAAFQQFYMPFFMIFFGGLAGILGVATVAAGRADG